jgi:hypothetical protein
MPSVAASPEPFQARRPRLGAGNQRHAVERLHWSVGQAQEAEL